MLELKTKKELAQYAHALATGHHFVRHRSFLYLPVDYETRTPMLTTDPRRTVWLRMPKEPLMRLAAAQHNVLFAGEGELTSFEFMVGQLAEFVDDAAKTMLVRTHQGLKELQPDGTFEEPSGAFVPNTVLPMLNTDQAAKDRVFQVISDWLDSEEEAHSLLSHVATSLAPGWSAVKYILLLGGGRNGKSLFLKMLHALYGFENVSNVTRQQIAEQSPVVTELNGKLLNIVYDGQAEYLKDSGAEKTLIAGETFPIRKLYESMITPVQTNALFIEGLQKEPKSKDKSSALQKRLVRFQFDNVYALDHRFERTMLSEESLGALLALLLDHFVTEDKVAELLAPTTKAIELQLEHMHENSMGLQFLAYLEKHVATGAAGLIGQTIDEVTAEFRSWRLKENDIGGWPDTEVMGQLNNLINNERKSRRINGKVTKIKTFTSFKPEAQAFLENLEGEEILNGSESELDIDALVAD